MRTSLVKNFLAASILLLPLSNNSWACSKITYTGKNNLIIVGRTLDWVEDMRSEIWAFPAGIARSGGESDHSITWLSKYGSVIVSAYNLGATDGMNTKGLDANLLYLSSSDFGEINPKYKNLSVFKWVQFMLDNYATVDEAVHDFELNHFNMLSPKLPNNAPSTVHLSITDASGDNAIFEYINGALKIHHGMQYTVMTNDPVYDQQLALNNYWQNLKGKFLPGTNTPEDRFVRASYYLKNAPQTGNEQMGAAIVASIMRNVSSPFSVTNSGKDNVAPTRWRTIADLTNMRYYYESTDRPNVFWVDLGNLQLDLGAKTKKLPLTNNEIYDGEQSKNFVEEKTDFD